MSQLQLKRISKEIIQHAEEGLVPDQKLPQVVDDYFVRRLKQEEMEQAAVDPNLVEGLRNIVQTEVLPLYEQFRVETARFRERKSKRHLWRYVLGTAAVCEYSKPFLPKAVRLFRPSSSPRRFSIVSSGYHLYRSAIYRRPAHQSCAPAPREIHRSSRRQSTNRCRLRSAPPIARC